MQQSIGDVAEYIAGIFSRLYPEEKNTWTTAGNELRLPYVRHMIGRLYNPFDFNDAAIGTGLGLL